MQFYKKIVLTLNLINLINFEPPFKLKHHQKNGFTSSGYVNIGFLDDGYFTMTLYFKARFVMNLQYSNIQFIASQREDNFIKHVSVNACCHHSF